jgi:hypothetical protein
MWNSLMALPHDKRYFIKQGPFRKYNLNFDISIPRIKKSKTVPVLNYLCTAPWRRMRDWLYIDPPFLDLCASWRWVVSFTLLSLYPQDIAPSNHWLGGWVSPRGGLGYGEVKILDPTETRTPTARSSSPQPVAIPTALPRLQIVRVCTELSCLKGRNNGRGN